VVPEFQNDETLPADDYGTFSESCSAHRLPVLYHLFTNIWQGTVSVNSTAEYKTILSIIQSYYQNHALIY
jgi:hypothetical protein